MARAVLLGFAANLALAHACRQCARKIVQLHSCMRYLQRVPLNFTPSRMGESEHACAWASHARPRPAQRCRAVLADRAFRHEKMHTAHPPTARSGPPRAVPRRGASRGAPTRGAEAFRLRLTHNGRGCTAPLAPAHAALKLAPTHIQCACHGLLYTSAYYTMLHAHTHRQPQQPQPHKSHIHVRAGGRG